ncbi:lipopolysaccharide biosynthesis protein [Microbacterium schleiferi]|uniref:lipopolysaccharide biosynthesis protein n=1 Tax=Microbacterium schleiferi TaxID=69362 RepID=UPI0035C8562E
MDLTSSARVTVFSQWIRFAAQIVGFIALSRLLTPADFGIVAMVAPIVTVALLFADLGFGLAAVQAPSLTAGQKSTLFYINVAAGGLGALVIAALGPVLASFYRQPELIPLAAVLATTLVFSGISSQFRVELNRDLRYRTMAIQDVIASLLALAAGVGGALVGWGYWAIAAQTVVQGIVIMAMGIAQARWFPGRPVRLGEVRSLLRFGVNALVVQAMNYTSSTVDVIALGRAQGATELGLYSRASQLVSMVFIQVTGPLTRVMLPRLSASAADDTAFAYDLIRTQRAVSYVLLLMVSLLAATAPFAAVSLFGPDWAPLGPLAQILCAGAVFQAMGMVYYWALLARARTGLLVIGELPGRAVMIIGAVALAPLGAAWVAAAISVGQLVIFVGSSVAVSRANIGAGALIRGALQPLAVGAYAAAVALGVSVLVPAAPALQLVTTAFAWALAVFSTLALQPIRRRIIDVLALVRR